MKISAGLVIIQNNKILLAHPTNAPWKNTYSFPKGGVEKDENYIETALRETKEEVGLDIPFNLIDKNNEYVIVYKNKQGKRYKKVYYYVVKLDDNTYPDVLDKNNLQLEEVDWAGFLNYDDAKEKIFWRFNEILNLIK